MSAFVLGMLVGGWIGATGAVMVLTMLHVAVEADKRDARLRRDGATFPREVGEA